MSIEGSNSHRLTFLYIPVQMLTKNARNPRHHPQEQIAQLSKSMIAFGVNRPIGVDEAR